MKKIIFITPEDAEYGFSLTGTNQHITREDKIEDTLCEIIKEPDTGLIVIDERLLKAVSEERLREIEKIWQGVMLVMPSPDRVKAEVEDFAARLIRRAIGYHVRLKL